MVNEAKIFILPIRCSVENRVMLSSRKWHPTLIGSKEPMFNAATVRLNVDWLVKSNAQRCHGEAYRCIKYQQSQIKVFKQSGSASLLQLVLLL